MNKAKIFKNNILLLFLVLNFNLSAQMMSQGNIFIHSLGNKTLFYDILNFKKANDGKLPGIIGTERNSPMGFFSFAEFASYLNASDSTYIDGYVRSFKNGSFIFPIGDNFKLRPAAISNASVENPINAAYFGVNPSIAITSNINGGLEPILPLGGPFNIIMKDSSILNVSNKEYWDINGKESTTISLSWDDSSSIINLTNNNLERLTIVGWNGQMWKEIPSIIDKTSFLGENSTLNKGSITTINAIKPDSFNVYTFARKICKPTGNIKILCSSNSSCDTLCKANSIITYGVSGVLNATGYYWIVNNGVKIISGQGTELVKLDISNANIGETKFTVIPFNNCDSMLSFNHTFTIFPETACENIVSLADTCITTGNTNLLIGPSIKAPEGGTISFKVNGLKNAGQASIDSNGLITFIPVQPQFLGKDTLYRIICITNKLGFKSCDTSFICITNSIKNYTPPVYDTTVESKEVIMAAIPKYSFQGGIPKINIDSPKHGIVKINPDETISYIPSSGYSGNDTFIINRCDSFGNCVKNYYYVYITPTKIIEPKPIDTNPCIPNYFSPNGDGVNDYFDLSCMSKNYPNLMLEVYNRWGNIVYRSIGAYKNNWKGEHSENNKPLPDGVYFYIIDLSNGYKEVKNGFIEIMR